MSDHSENGHSGCNGVVGTEYPSPTSSSIFKFQSSFQLESSNLWQLSGKVVSVGLCPLKRGKRDLSLRLVLRAVKHFRIVSLQVGYTVVARQYAQIHVSQ